ncbi:MAG: hypothetical protein Q8Q36_02250, partial [bacterium]|nr:hypothetical protein [bacterium]
RVRLPVGPQMKKIKPQHFDILGALAFAYVAIFAVYSLTNNEQAPVWSIIFLAVVGIGGLLVDLAIVFVYFVWKNKGD